jgi:hypothetical protein
MKFTIIAKMRESAPILTEDEIMDMLIDGSVPVNLDIVSVKAVKKEKPVNLELLPPPTDVRSRFVQFKELIFNFYKYINSGTAPVWDASDSKQLHNLLRVRLDLTVQEFREWLVNYMESQNVNYPDRPRMFLPRITSYANGPLDKYGKPLVVPKRRIL